MKASLVLYQAGCLTVTDYDDELQQFALDYSNTEAIACFAKSLLEYCFQPLDEKVRTSLCNIARDLLQMRCRGGNSGAAAIIYVNSFCEITKKQSVTIKPRFI